MSRPSRTVRVGALAGIPWDYVVEDGLAVRSPDFEQWAHAAALEERVRVVHRLGPVDPGIARLVLDMPPTSRYYAAEEGVKVLFSTFDGRPAKLLCTCVEGYEYEVRYASATVPTDARDVELALASIVLASRGNGLFLHGCGFVLPSGVGVACPANSGTGKSTLARMVAGASLTVLNDDRLVVTTDDGRFRLWASPWPGMAGIAQPGDAPLGVVAFLARAARMKVRRVTPGEALQRIVQTVPLPMWSARELSGALDLLDGLLRSLPLIEIAYPPSEEAARWVVSITSEATQ